MKAIVFILSGIASVAHAGAQQVWKVCSAPGSGADFATLSAAVAAASPGDTLWLYSWPGFLNSGVFAATLIDKPLRIVGFQVGGPTGNNIPTRATLTGHVEVAAIPAGTHLVLTNLFLRHPAAGASSVLVRDCQGAVVIDDFDLQNAGAFANQSIRIERCENVAIRGSQWKLGGDKVAIIDSNVLMTTFLLEHVDPFAPPYLGGYPATHESIFLQRSTLTLSGSIVIAHGERFLQTAGTPFPSWNPPRNAIVMDSSSLVISPSTLVRGGGIPGTPGTIPNDFIPAVAFVGAGTSTVHRDARTPPANYGTLPVITTPLHEVFHDWVVGDEDFHVTVLGPQGGFALLALGEYIPWAQTPLGSNLAFDPATVFTVGITPLSAQLGFHEWTLHCPGTAMNGFAFVLQALTLSPQGELGLTIPSPLTVGWDKDRIP
jgi:hypothetical protein